MTFSKIDIDTLIKNYISWQAFLLRFFTSSIARIRISMIIISILSTYSRFAYALSIEKQAIAFTNLKKSIKTIEITTKCKESNSLNGTKHDAFA
ncbi:hypothetical protein BV378_03220 [Nostoc sp. RF31YmG]|nr:hypothetical protein BV378_03220 [Nostoc sp. RF31YmG]